MTSFKVVQPTKEAVLVMSQERNATGPYVKPTLKEDPRTQRPTHEICGEHREERERKGLHVVQRRQ